MSMHAKNQVNKNSVKTPENEITREHVMLLKILWKPPRMVHQQQPAGFTCFIALDVDLSEVFNTV